MLPQSNDFTFHILEKKMLLLNFTTDWESYRSVLHVWDKVTERWERQSEIQMSKMQNIEYFTALNPPVKPLWTWKNNNSENTKTKPDFKWSCRA